MPTVEERNKKVLALLKPGDLVKFYRTLYTHWGVYEGNGKVINVSGTFLDKLEDRVEIKREDFLKIADGDETSVGNEMDAYWKPLDVNVILARAVKQIGQVFYNVFCHNCEHFAKWCRYDRNQSSQAEMFVPHEVCELMVDSIEHQQMKKYSISPGSSYELTEEAMRKSRCCTCL
ncbi:phospholipase A and acyltransferase 3-like [Physella acuta]|uniref:phospholipase A and acyltransferase 3-like n=1 Tax=Physella acuta TaxID=109671 RepID=UPI0027DDB8AA|nr:phospholipase A and acyltransferase 3-like [Physella acuta]